MKQKDFNQKFVEFISTNSSESDELLFHMKDGAKLSAARALDIYKEDYQARLTEALRNTYRGINAIIGDEDFLILSRDYIKRHSSTSPDLDDYGDQMDLFLKRHPLIKDYIFLSDLAHFEWNFREVFHLDQEVGLSIQDLISTLQNENDLVQLAKSARILKYNYLITSLYALKDFEDEIEPFDFEIPQFILIYKSDVRVKTQVLSKNQIEIVQKFIHPVSLKICLENAPSMVTQEEIQNLFQIFGIERLILKSN